MYRLYKDGEYIGQFHSFDSVMTEALRSGIKSMWKSVSLSPQAWKAPGIMNVKTGAITGEGLIIFEEDS